MRQVLRQKMSCEKVRLFQMLTMNIQDNKESITYKDCTTIFFHYHRIQSNQISPNNDFHIEASFISFLLSNPFECLE